MRNPYRFMVPCLWAGPVFTLALGVFWGVLGHNIPPYSAALEAQAIADHFREHTMSVRIGMVMTMLFGILYVVWGMGITKIMEAIERDNDILSRLQLLGAAFTVIIIELPAALWLTAAFRPETNPAILQMLYDLGWIFLDMTYSLAGLQFVALGVCILVDERAKPLIPKWVGWFVLWVAFMLMLFLVMPFVKTGPFARDGLLNYWVGFSLFFYLIAIVSVCLFRALRILRSEAGTLASDA